MHDSRIVIERPVGNPRFYVAIAVLACTTLAFFALAASDEEQWMLYPLGGFHLVGLLALLFRCPSASIVIERDSIAWCGDGLFWPTSNLVSFIEISSIELRDNGSRSTILLHNRYSKPYIIASNCFADGKAVLSAIHQLRPNLPICTTSG